MDENAGARDGSEPVRSGMAPLREQRASDGNAERTVPFGASRSPKPAVMGAVVPRRVRASAGVCRAPARRRASLVPKIGL